jgi:hypothetical protein
MTRSSKNMTALSFIWTQSRKEAAKLTQMG